MADHFSFGGTQDCMISRALDANDRWIPDPAATVTNLVGGTTVPGFPLRTHPGIAEMAATTASAGSGAGTAVGSGFFQQENVPLTVWFEGLIAATVALQFLNYHTTTWHTIIYTDKWLDEPAKVILYPGTHWRVGCITKSTDTLRVCAAFMRSDFGRHA
jgi:hypothetical protein